MAKVNISLLAKQGWRILTNPSSLVSQVLKAKYFPETNFLNSRLGNNCSYTWKSIWATRGILSEGLCWKVRKGTEILIKNDSWIPDLNYARLSSHFVNLRDYRVAELIDESKKA